MAAGFAGFGMKMLEQLGMNTSNRIGTGASLRHMLQREQVKQTRLEAEAGIMGRIDAAKAAGIHPLVALGSNVGSAITPQVMTSFNSSGYTFGEEAMQDRELKARREELEYQRQYQRDRDSLQDKYNKAAAANALEEQALRNELTRAQIEAQRKQMADSDRDFAAAQAQLARQNAANSNPYAKPSLQPQYIKVRDRFGNPVTIPNPDLYDLELPESVGAGTLLLPERQSPWWRELTEPGPAWKKMMKYFRGEQPAPSTPARK